MAHLLRALVVSALLAVVVIGYGPRQAHAGPSAPLTWHGFLAEPLPAVGKLYLTGRDGWPSVCSGTVVGPSLVLTAAHCLYTNAEMAREGLGRTGYRLKVEFVPMHGYDARDRRHDARPHGTWTARRFWVPRQFRRGDDAFDFGLVELAPDAQGSTVADRVGAYPVTYDFDWRPGLRVLSVGYPAGGYFGKSPDAAYGNGQYACDARYTGAVQRYDSGVDRVIACTMTGGSSGGPWLATAADGTRSVVGLNSRGSDTEAGGQVVGDEMLTPTFGRAFASFWRSVERQLARP